MRITGHSYAPPQHVLEHPEPEVSHAEADVSAAKPAPPPPTLKQRQEALVISSMLRQVNESILEIVKNVGRDDGPASPPAGTPAPPPDGGDAGTPPTQSSDEGTEPPKVIWG